MKHFPFLKWNQNEDFWKLRKMKFTMPLFPHFLVGFQIHLLHLIMKICPHVVNYLGSSVTVQSTL